MVVKKDKIEINEKIQFEVMKATILPASFGLLDEMVDVIKKNPQIKKISIEGHASAEGDPRVNLKLSDDRSKSVMEYFVKKGIDGKRLTAKGFGVSKPIGDNKTPEGREKNRRVEFNIVEQDEVTHEVDAPSGKPPVKPPEKAPAPGDKAPTDKAPADKAAPPTDKKAEPADKKAPTPEKKP